MHVTVDHLPETGSPWWQILLTALGLVAAATAAFFAWRSAAAARTSAEAAQSDVELARREAEAARQAQAAEAEERLRAHRREEIRTLLSRRRESCNAARAVFAELHGIVLPIERAVQGLEAWQPPRYAREMWDDSRVRLAVVDALSFDAQIDIERAYYELGALDRKLKDETMRLPEALMLQEGKLARRFLDMHVEPARKHLLLAIAASEAVDETLMKALERLAPDGPAGTQIAEADADRP